jgi:hypothetical protein
VGSRTTALNEVTAARSSGGPGPASKSKPTNLKTSKKTKVVEYDESEIAPAIGDEDHTKEREAALSSPMKGRDSRKLTAVSITSHLQSFSDYCYRLKLRLNVKKKMRYFLPMRKKRSRMILYLILCRNTRPRLIVSLP